MGEQTVFDLNYAIAAWRRLLEQNTGISSDHIDELESHLRDELDRPAHPGPVTQEEFDNAVAKLGDVNMLNEEFSKVHAEHSGLLKVIGGGVLAMNSEKTFTNNRFTTVLLFIGFCGIFGWLGTTCWQLQGWTNSRHWASWNIIAATVARFSLPGSFFLIFTLIGIPWGLKLLRRSEHRLKLVVRSLVPAVVLSPVYIFVGMTVILLAPLWGGWVRAAFVGHKIVQSQLSPNGKFEAYVLGMPSFDPPNHHLYIRCKNTGFSEKIAQLPEDVDSIQEIQWSQYNDIVVFRTWFSLIAVRVSDYRVVKIPLGGEKHWRKNGTFWVDYQDVKRIAALEFPEPGAFSYLLEGSPEPKILKMDSF
jgi:hypothetical protein